MAVVIFTRRLNSNILETLGTGLQIPSRSEGSKPQAVLGFSGFRPVILSVRLDKTEI